MASAYAKLMGAPLARLDSGVFPFADDKRHQLLAYLAFKGDWVNREALAYLFWPEVETRTARKDLRHLLGRVRGLGGLAEGLEAQGEWLRWAIPTDVQAFLGAVQGAHWEQALRLYGGCLLEGFLGEDSPEFMAWLETERGHLSGCWRGAVLQQAQTLRDTGKPQEASQLLGQLLEQDELDEEALEAYMRAAVQIGGRGLALKAYTRFCQKLLQELDLRPTGALEQLAQAIREDHPIPPIPPPAQAVPTPIKARTLPIPTTPFVGREALLQEIVQRLVEGGYRLLTLSGPGGVGKTRLAIATALQLQPRFAGGAYFASLVPLASPTALPAAIAEAIGFSLEGGSDPLEQITGQIAEREMLLVLDNFEHLLGAAPQVARLVQGCPNLRVLVTSRERLGLEAESVLPIEGLAIPASPAQALGSDAVRLFALRVQRLRPQFKAETGNLADILEICRLVEGFPLGIELAAVWARALPLGAIAAEIARDTDFLSASSDDLTPRHRSIRAAFEHSWRLLAPDEQAALRRLSVFRGGFEREAARLAGGISLPVLASLVDKSLLYTDASGRYFRHVLLYQYMGEKLSENPTEEQMVQSEHGSYYLRLLQRYLEGIRGANPRSTFTAMEVELENLRAAWSWALREGKAHLIKAGVEALMRFFDAQKRYQDGIEVFAEALDQLNPQNPEHRAAIGTLWVHQAKLYERLGHLEVAETLTQRALTLLRPLRELEPIIWGLGTLGVNAAARGDQAQALAYRKEALHLARGLRSERLMAVCFGWLAISEDQQGHYSQAKTYYREAIHRFKQMGNRIGALYSLNNLAQLTLDLGELEEAEPLLEEALEQARATQTHALIAEILIRLGSCHCKLKNYSEAETYSQQALERVQESEDPLLETELHLSLGEIALAKGQSIETKPHLIHALDRAWGTGDLPLVMRVLLRWAEYLEQQGKTAQGLLQLISTHTATLSVEKDRAQELLKGYDGLDQIEVGGLEETVQQLLYS
ncbi:MAG: tetratricopeptide repeat protein [Thermaceae bacterium]|nr:tetratricopeptide repeat protein [Thermaceae bacterium]